ncbi:MAG: hypothetical protein UV64_C0006G0021 [Parcubacteria group bacterium GW2011_GWC1_43_11b]|uniref:Uncharacterized protein n=2 Tax=Candidatus Vogeliibacteriota TaxID=1817922 RepID=A0A1G2QEF3_9BACT|nr:MAG: hypothetical protein UV50_C0004G0033 [Parcubacteria group bacterium GW2011_GWB1_42_9]KKS89441.1 MAG: hypothetical protein UV64_C0006G0021 [Parcubacteria group bacterium GW2011_GWC1_43_11b]KKT10028.1 MAG: hypothetical protein UV88_C0003G0030 [Parcubacteria group bacterium GW2011_GWA1_43_21]OHA58008.1 MAG: hypothetical protein A2607_00945 [Candidatus Vogelbacteria bacterium RIFOXYD1_FULL_42_15]OHA58351.1 MAG: hypothetical protein A2370_01385 [Candidatus Vogelbacteria bacterium RIFOXYB1_FU
MSKQILADLIKEKLGIADLSVEEQEKILLRLEEQILRRATLDILESLPAGEKAELEAIISASDDETIVRFLREKLGVNLDEVMTKTANEHLADLTNSD